MKKFYTLQVNSMLRLFGRSEIPLRNKFSERTLRNMADKLYRAQSRRQFEVACSFYGI